MLLTLPLLVIVVPVVWLFGYWGAASLHDPVIEAARAGDLGAVRRLARWDPFLSRTGFEEHHPPLTEAVEAGHVEIVRYLLDRGVDVNALDDGGGTALHAARQMGRADLARLLEQAGGVDRGLPWPKP